MTHARLVPCIAVFAATALACGTVSACKKRTFNTEVKTDTMKQNSLFASEEILRFKLEGPFWGLSDKPAPAMLTLEGRSPASVSISERGKTSRSVCEFGKLVVQIDKAEDKDTGEEVIEGADQRSAFLGSELEGTGSFNIGTHCDMIQGGDPLQKAGRLGTEVAVYREYTIYKMIAAFLGEDAHRVRPALITYTDTVKNVTITRQALLLERKRPLAKRIGSKVVDPKTVWVQDTDPLQIAKARLAYILSGSMDYRFFGGAVFAPARPFDAPGPTAEEAQYWWNVYPVRDKVTNKAKLIPYDFDIGFLVNPEIMKFRYDDPEFLGNEPLALRNAISLVHNVQMVTAPDIFAQAIAALREAKPRIENALARSPVDEEGRMIASRHAAAMQSALEPQWLNFKTFKSIDNTVYVDEEKTKVACRGALPGSLIRPIEEKAGLVRFRFINRQQSNICEYYNPEGNSAYFVDASALDGGKPLVAQRRPASEEVRKIVPFGLYSMKSTFLKAKSGHADALGATEKCDSGPKAKTISVTTANQRVISKPQDIEVEIQADVDWCPIAKKGAHFWIWGEDWGIIGG